MNLTKDRVTFSKVYSPNKVVALLNHPLTKEEWEQILENQEIVKRLKKLPFDLILQHIRDSFAEDRELMSDDAQIKTTKCIKDIDEIQKMLEGVENNEI